MDPSRCDDDEAPFKARLASSLTGGVHGLEIDVLVPTDCFDGHVRSLFGRVRRGAKGTHRLLGDRTHLPRPGGPLLTSVAGRSCASGGCRSVFGGETYRPLVA